MLTLTVVSRADTVHVYCTRWVGHTRYPQRVIDLDLAREDGETGRAMLARACNAVLARLAALDAGDAPEG